jgi:hypothetical protein
MSSVPRPSFRASCSRVRLNLNWATESEVDMTELVTGYSTSSQKKQGPRPRVLGRLVHILDFFFFPGLCFAHVLHILLTSPHKKQGWFCI